MTRRDVFRSAIAATAAVAVTADAKPQPREWITVAHTGWNNNGHSYTPDALKKIRDEAPGKHVQLVGLDHDHQSGDLENLRGIVTAAITPDESHVKIKVRWFSMHEPPIGMFICPCGVAGSSVAREGHAGYYDIDAAAYSLEYFMLSDHSAFELADRV